MFTQLAPLRLGVNIDHVATLRNARGGHHPDPVAAALLAIDAGADVLRPICARTDDICVLTSPIRRSN